MRRTVQRSEESHEEKHEISPASRTKPAVTRMLTVKDLTRPKLGLALGFCLCLFSALMIFTMSKYYKGKLERRDDVINNIKKDIREGEKVRDPKELKGLNNYDKEQIGGENSGSVFGDEGSESAGKQTDSTSEKLPRVQGGRFSDNKRNNEILAEKVTKNLENKIRDDEKILDHSQVEANAGNNYATTANEINDTQDKRHPKEEKNEKINIGQTNQTKESSQEKINEKNREEFYVLLQLVNAYQESKFANNFYHCIKSILRRTKLPLKFILTVDDLSKKTAEKIFHKVKSELKLQSIPQRTYFLIDDINKKVFPHTKALQVIKFLW